MKHTFQNRKARVIYALLFVGPIAGLTAAMPLTALAVTTVFAGAGTQPGDIKPIVDEFRVALGNPDNGGVPGPKPTGRREINWDTVPDAYAAPNFLPSDFFNAATSPRARGAFLSTPGDGVQVSADSNNPAHAAVRFGHINLTYSQIFKTFSKERLFSPIKSNIVNLTFLVPGSHKRALVRGFGAVYTDVDKRKSSFKFFNKDGGLLGTFTVPVSNRGLSFLGVVFDKPVVARVRIEYGTTPLGPNDNTTNDVAVMDNFIYGEPKAIP
jgi:hypothetical protein